MIPKSPHAMQNSQGQYYAREEVRASEDVYMPTNEISPSGGFGFSPVRYLVLPFAAQTLADLFTSVYRSSSDSLKSAFKIRFSAARYSFCSRSFLIDQSVSADQEPRPCGFVCFQSPSRKTAIPRHIRFSRPCALLTIRCSM